MNHPSDPKMIYNRYRRLSAIDSDEKKGLYHAEDTRKIGGRHALFILKPEERSSQLSMELEDIQKEIVVFKKWCHPNVIGVNDCGVTPGGGLYFCMDWDGGGMKHPEKDPLSLKHIFQMMVQVCHGLNYFHHKGMVFGNLKPSSLIWKEEQVRILSYEKWLGGGKKALNASHELSQYAAPEFFDGGRGDHRSDLYAIGAIGYAFITGHSLRDHEKELERESIIPKDILQNEFAVPLKESQLIHRLLSLSPEDRFQNTDTVIAALNDIVDRTFMQRQFSLHGICDRNYFTGRLIGREKEIEALNVMTGQSSSFLIVINGPPGVGKSRLVQAFSDLTVKKGERVFFGNCNKEDGIAYGPFRNVLRQLIPYVKEEYKDDYVIEDTHWAVLASLIPELLDESFMSKIPQLEPLDPPATQQRLNNTILHMLRLAARRSPTTIVIEDAQFMDEASQAIIKQLCRASREDQLIICLTCETKQNECYDLINECEGEKIQHLLLAPLSRENTTALVSDLLSIKNESFDFSDYIYEVTHGNPLFVTAMIRYLAKKGEVLHPSLNGWKLILDPKDTDEIPKHLNGVIEGQLYLLSKDTIALLAIGAMMGTVFWDGALENISGYSKDDILKALDEALQQELISENRQSALKGNREFVFTHSTIQNIALKEVVQKNQHIYHVRFAAWLRQVSKRRFDEYLGTIAGHLEKAGQTEGAINYLIQAGEHSFAQFANLQAIDYLNRALALLPEDEWVERYAILRVREQINRLRGDRDKEAIDLAKLEALADYLDDDQRRIQVLDQRITYKELIGDLPGAILDIKQMITLSEKIHDIEGLSSGYYHWAGIQWRKGDYTNAIPKLEQTIAMTEAAHLTTVQANANRILGNIYRRLGDFEKSMALSQKTLELDRKNGNYDFESIQIMNNALIFFSLGDYEKANAYLLEALALSKKIGYVKTEMTILVNGAELKTLVEDYNTALTYAKWGYQLALDLNSPRFQAYAAMYIGDALHGLERLDTAYEGFELAHAMQKKQGMDFEVMKIKTSMADIALRRGEVKACQMLIDKILSFEAEHTLIGASEPFRVYLMLYQVLCKLEDKRADGILETAHRLLQEQAKEIKEEHYLKCFLENVMANRTILKLYSKKFPNKVVQQTPVKPIRCEDSIEKEKCRESLVRDLEKARHKNRELKTLALYYTKSEEVLWESEKQFRSIAVNAMDAVIIFDEKENVLFWNRAADHIFGYTLNNVNHQILISLLILKIKAGFKEEIRQLKRREKIELVQKTKVIDGIRIDGTEFPLEISLSSWKKKKAILFSAIGRDVTERKQFESALQNSKNKTENANSAIAKENKRLLDAMDRIRQMILKVEHASRGKSEFLASMNHELRTPMNAIMVMTHLALDSNLERDQRGYFESIQSVADDFMGIIDRIMNFTNVKPDKACHELDTTQMPEKEAEVTIDEKMPSGDDNGLHILLAEDNKINQMMASRLLEKLGHTVRVVENGKQALNLVGKETFDMVLMDIEMPEMDGIEATREIRKLKSKTRNIPVVAITAYAMKGYKEKCFDVGMNDYMTKPIEPPILIKMLEKWGRQNVK